LDRIKSNQSIEQHATNEFCHQDHSEAADISEESGRNDRFGEIGINLPEYKSYESQDPNNDWHGNPALFQG
jgi:hypothetical protein